MGSKNIRLTNAQVREFFQPQGGPLRPYGRKTRLDLLASLDLPLDSWVEIIEYNSQNGIPNAEGPLIRITHPSIT